MTINNDQQYIDKVLDGDPNAFAFLVDKYKDMVYSLAIKITKNREEAEEVSQDSFIKAFNSLKHFKGDAKFSTWLYKIAYHNCIDRVKKNARTYQTGPIDEVNENRIKAIEDTLQAIERNERAILWLFYFDELSLKEIKEVTSFSEANIKVKLHRARKRLLHIVKDKVEPELINHYGR